MPYRGRGRRRNNYRRRNYRRRNYRRRRYKPRPTVSTLTLRRGVGFPDRYRCKLRYTEFLDFSPTGSIFKNFIYVGNGPQDPEVVSGGEQPTYYDELASIYNKYRVFASKCVVNFVPNSTSSGQASLMAYVFPSVENTSSIGFSKPAGIAELPYARSIGLSNVQGQQSRVIKHYMTTARIWGTNPQKVRDDDLFASPVNTQPSNQWFWTVGVATLDNASDPICKGQVTITYYVEFYSREFMTDQDDD